MNTITKTRLIERLSEHSDPQQIAVQVDQAIAALGWQDRASFNGTEVITLGTKMAELTQAALAASADPVDRSRAEGLKPYLETMRDDVLPNLDPNR